MHRQNPLIVAAREFIRAQDIFRIIAVNAGQTPILPPLCSQALDSLGRLDI